MYKYIVLSFLCFLGTFATEHQSLKDCLAQDSISCVQLTIFRKARDFFDQQEINLLDGLSFIKTNSRNARAFNVEPVEVENAPTVESRETALENYVTERAMRFVEERSVNVNLMSVGRAISSALPEEVKESMRSMVGEARKKKKKLLKKLGPLFSILKLKLSGLALIGVFVVGLIAKKALVIATLALILAKVGLLKSLISGGASLASGLGSAFGGGKGGFGKGGSEGSSGGIAEVIGLGSFGGSSAGGDSHSVAYGGYAPQSHY